MQIDKSLKLLKKINTVYHDILEDGDGASALEQQLLRNYVIQFYDAIIEESSSNSASVSPPTTSEEAIETPIVDKPSGLPDPTPAAAPKEPVQVQEVVAERVVDDVAVLVNAENGNGQTLPFLQELFEAVEGELHAGHLGQKMIKDLKKAIGLNDKLRYATDLFGGNQSQLLETLEMMNEEKEVDRVKTHINELAKKYNWQEESKKSTVRNFLQLILSKKRSA